MKNQENVYRLEYNEKKGHFRLEGIDTNLNENSFGWTIIASEITDNESRLFFDYIEYGFPFEFKKIKSHKVLCKFQLFNKILNFKKL